MQIQEFLRGSCAGRAGEEWNYLSLHRWRTGHRARSLKAKLTGKRDSKVCSNIAASISFSELVHGRFGYNNVGFHLGADYCNDGF